MHDTNEPTALKITTLSDGMMYLDSLVLANPVTAERQLVRLIDSLLADPPDPGVLFPLLEQIRVPLCFVEEELALVYQNKPIPLGEQQEKSFEMVLQAWHKIGKAYALCASMEEPDTNNPDYEGLMATILHRCIYYVGMVILDHYRARRELSAGIWLELHGFYETAEQWGLEFTLVSDPIENTIQATHCAAAYINLLLIEVASPYSNSVRNLNLIRRWASMWAPLVGIHKLEDDLELPPYVLELMKDAPLHPSSAVEGTLEHVRCLDTSRLGLQIEHCISQLHQRMTPSQLGLGEEGASYVINLLEQLAKPWKQHAAARRFRRFPTEGQAIVVVGFEPMYSHISGETFEQPDSAAAYSRGKYDQLFTFGDRVDPGQSLKINPVTNFPTENWSVINHSATGFRLGRSGAGQRVTHGELMAIRPHDGESFLLAYATWLMQERSGGLIVGVATLPGLPRGVSFRPLAQGGEVRVDVRYAPAFILPALPAMKEDASLVLPPGIYQAGHDLEVVDGKTLRRVRMNRVVHRQIAFDRVSIIDL